MALANILLLSQIAGYVIALILSLCIVVPMSLQQDDFRCVHIHSISPNINKQSSFNRGHCLLFSTGVWLEQDGQFKVDWASQAYCNYTIFVGVALGLVSLIQIYRFSMYLYKGTDSTFLSAFIDCVSGIILCGMTILAAIMITLGFMAWCDNMTQRFPSYVEHSLSLIGIKNDSFQLRTSGGPGDRQARRHKHNELLHRIGNGPIRRLGLVHNVGGSNSLRFSQALQIPSAGKYTSVHVQGETAIN